MSPEFVCQPGAPARTAPFLLALSGRALAVPNTLGAFTAYLPCFPRFPGGHLLCRTPWAPLVSAYQPCFRIFSRQSRILPSFALSGRATSRCVPNTLGAALHAPAQLTSLAFVALSGRATSRCVPNTLGAALHVPAQLTCLACLFPSLVVELCTVALPICVSCDATLLFKFFSVLAVCRKRWRLTSRPLGRFVLHAAPAAAAAAARSLHRKAGYGPRLIYHR